EAEANRKAEAAERVEAARAAQVAKQESSQRRREQPQGLSQAGTRLCPYCAEEIAVAAIKCKYCGEFIAAATPAAHPAKKKQFPTWAYIVIALFVVSSIMRAINEEP